MSVITWYTTKESLMSAVNLDRDAWLDESVLSGCAA
jgi:hypothetical protein